MRPCSIELINCYSNSTHARVMMLFSVVSAHTVIVQTLVVIHRSGLPNFSATVVTHRLLRVAPSWTFHHTKCQFRACYNTGERITRTESSDGTYCFFHTVIFDFIRRETGYRLSHCCHPPPGLWTVQSKFFLFDPSMAATVLGEK